MFLGHPFVHILNDIYGPVVIKLKGSRIAKSDEVRHSCRRRNHRNVKMF
jgi:hypothetical protein